jgi:predicted transcriptional regulator
MAKAAIVSGMVEDSVASSLDRLAARLHRGRDAIVAEAVEAFVMDQNEFLDSLEEAERQIDRGEFSTQADVEIWFEARRGRAALG